MKFISISIIISILICLIIICVFNYPRKKIDRIGIFGSVSKEVEPNSLLYKNIVNLAKNLPNDKFYITPNTKKGILGILLNNVNPEIRDRFITFNSVFFKDNEVNTNYKIINTKNILEYEKILFDTSKLNIFLPGGIGTFFEIISSIFLLAEGVDNEYILILNIDGFYESIFTHIDNLHKNGYLRNNVYKKFIDKVHVFDNSEDIIHFITTNK